MKNFLLSNLGYVSAVTALAVEFIMRKIPGSTTLLKMLYEGLGKVPGFKDIQ